MGRKKVDFVGCTLLHAPASLQAWSANHPQRSIISANTTLGSKGSHSKSVFFTIIYEEVEKKSEHKPSRHQQ